MGDAEEGFLAHELARLNGELKTINQALRETEAYPALESPSSWTAWAPAEPETHSSSAAPRSPEVSLPLSPSVMSAK